MDNTKICWASVNIYDNEETVPKRLAKENEEISNDGTVIEGTARQFCLTPGKNLYEKVLWYQWNETWMRAEQTGKMWRIPGDAMRCHTICRMSFCSAKVKIAFTSKCESPDHAQERILVFHFLNKSGKSPDSIV